MFRNWLSAAWGDLARSPVQAFISIGGLAIGLAAMLAIGLMESSVFAYDSFVQDHDRVYLAALHSHDAHGDVTAPVTPHELAGYFKEFPEVEAVTRAAGGIVKGKETVFVRRGKITARERMNWADPGFFQIYRTPVLYGDLDTALDRPDGAVLNLSTARKYFSKDDVVGSTLEIDHNRTVVIRAVIVDQPVTATFRAGLFLSGLSSYSTMSNDISRPGMSREKGFSPDMFTLVRLRPGASLESLDKRASALVAPFAAPPVQVDIRFMPLGQILFTLVDGLGAQLLVLAGVAFVILALSCINFVNLSIARSAQRAVEVAIRKTAGAGRAALVVQFLGESLVQVLLALLVASAIVEWIRPALEAFSDGTAIPDYWRNPALLAAVLSATVFIGLAAGMYPALILSGFRPSAVLKGWIVNSLKRGRLRTALVAFQFAAMIVFLIASGVLFQQNAFLQTDPRRVPLDNTMLIKVSTCGTALETEISFISGVRAVACSSTAMLDDGLLSVGARRKDGQPVEIKLAPVGVNFFEFYGLKPLAGRFFRRSSGDDATGTLIHVVIDETAVHQLGFATPQAAVGQSIDFQGVHRTIIGVVKNFFLLQPTQGQGQPMMYSLGIPVAPLAYVIHVKFQPKQLPAVQDAIDALWRKTGAQSSITELILDQFVQINEREIGGLGVAFAFFAGVAMVLACLGLFGISLLSAQRRIKEIGVRKAMGATTHDIVRLLLWQFVKPVLWANMIAWPVAFYAMSKWLSGFGYHVALDWRVFVGATLAAFFVALLTVAAQSIAAALAGPASALRHE